MFGAWIGCRPFGRWVGRGYPARNSLPRPRPRRPACPARLADKISSPSHWWSIGTRVVWHLLRVSPGAPTNLACEGRVACLNGLVRGACQPHSSKRRFASQRPRRNRRRRATRFRWRDCPGRECVPPRRDHSGTVLTGRGLGDDSRESTAGIRGVGLASEKSGMALPATLLLTRAPHRDCGGRAAAARLPPS